MADEEQGYAWETEYEKTWEALKEDEAGLLQGSVEDIINKNKRKRLLERPVNIRLGMMRHLYLVVDMSKAMEDQDLKPNRALAMIKLLEQFVAEYFDQNPVSQLGILAMRSKRVERISDLSGNRKRHLASLATLRDSACQGEPSLQNALELAAQNLRHMPAHASREVLIIFGNLSTCDPGNIYDSIKVMKSHNIRCSVIGLGASVHVCQKICIETLAQTFLGKKGSSLLRSLIEEPDCNGLITAHGKYNVILDESHFKDLLTQHMAPPPATVNTESSLLKMGFPHHETQATSDNKPSMCMCHLDSKSTSQCFGRDGYFCPQCSSKYCDLPVECVACGLTLISAPHLARSYHHLFPLPAFAEVTAGDIFKQNRYCFSCQKFISEVHAYKCAECTRVFCIDCDIFIHETLHSCPGCSSKRTAPL